MEYYEGILFLTTNKVGSFDEAFKSRMSMALYYPPLTQEQTKRIWEMQMDRTEELSEKAAPEDVSQHVKFNREEIAALSATLWNMQTTRDDCKPVWNGRQIRNAFQTAVALAEWHKKENHVSGPIIVRGDHFEKVARVSNEFNAYLYEVKHGRPDYEKAHTKEHRFDDFNRQQFVFGGQSFGQGQQGYGMSGVWQSPHQGNVIYSGQAGSVMGGNPIGGVPYGSNMQNQGAFLTNQTWQPGYGGTGNTGMGNLNMAGQSVGNSGGGNNMGAGMSPGSVNVQVLPGQSIQGQMNNPQQQQQQQQQSSSSMGQGGPMQPGFR
ncbi:AAA family ATPase [Colletotrichum tofieldiae]|nr:AAA family ATPase [Colletotrichum tofieldiae]